MLFLAQVSSSDTEWVISFKSHKGPDTLMNQKSFTPSDVVDPGTPISSF